MSIEVPEGWGKRPLREVAKSFAGGTPTRGNPANYGPGIPWLKSGEVRAGRILEIGETITEFGLKNSSARIAKSGTPVIAMYGATAGVAGILGLDAAMNQAVLAVVPDPHQLDSEFCYRILDSQTRQLLTMTQGSGQPNLSKGLIDQLEVLLPPLDEQRRIAEVLRSVGEAIESAEQVARQKLKLWETLVEARIWTPAFADPSLLAPLSKSIRASDYGVNAPLTDEAVGTAILRMGNIQDGQIDLTNLKWGVISDEEARPLRLCDGDILFNRTNSRDLVGKVALVRGKPDYLYASYLVRLSVDQTVSDPYFIFAIMNSRRGQAAFKTIATPGVSQSNINPTNLKKLSFPLFDLSAQRKIVGELRAVESARLASLAELATLRSTFADLSSQLLSGSVRVPA